MYKDSPGKLTKVMLLFHPKSDSADHGSTGNCIFNKHMILMNVGSCFVKYALEAPGRSHLTLKL